MDDGAAVGPLTPIAKEVNVPLGDVLAIVGLVLTLGGWLFTWIRSSRRWPLHELWYEIDAEPIARREGLAGQIRVTVDDRPVADPHTVILHIWSTGRSDIPSTKFDGGEPITFNLGVPIVGNVEFASAEEDSRVYPDQSGPTTLEIRPGLIRRTLRLEARFLTDGAPQLSVRHALTDTTIQSVADAETEEDRRFLWTRILAAFFMFVPLLGIVAGFVLQLLGLQDVIDSLKDYAALLFVSFFAGVFFMTIPAWYPTRWARAMKKRGTFRWYKTWDMNPFDPALIRRRNDGPRT